MPEKRGGEGRGGEGEGRGRGGGEGEQLPETAEETIFCVGTDREAPDRELGSPSERLSRGPPPQSEEQEEGYTHYSHLQHLSLKVQYLRAGRGLTHLIPTVDSDSIQNL